MNKRSNFPGSVSLKDNEICDIETGKLQSVTVYCYRSKTDDQHFAVAVLKHSTLLEMISNTPRRSGWIEKEQQNWHAFDFPEYITVVPVQASDKIDDDVSSDEELLTVSAIAEELKVPEGYIMGAKWLGKIQAYNDDGSRKKGFLFTRTEVNKLRAEVTTRQ